MCIRDSTMAVQTTGSMGFAAPGTFMLAMVFLLAFILYYFINWKYLSLSLIHISEPTRPY